MRRIAFINEKGGTGKTTLAVNVAAYLAHRRRVKVLLVDLDTQGHAGKALGVDVRDLTPNAFHLLADPTLRLADVARPTPVENLHLVPSYKEMADLPMALAAQPRREHRLAERLEDAEALGFDVVIFDSPPSLGLTAVNILVAATEVVLPVATSYLALDGCAEMVETIRRVREQHRRTDLPISLVVATMYRKTALAEQILEKLSVYFPRQLARTPLAVNVKIDEAQSHGQSIFEYAPRSKGASMLADIAEQLWDGNEVRAGAAA